MGVGTLKSSGSSLNIPSGSGSERLCRASISVLNNSWQEILGTTTSGQAGHIYTILSVICCNKTSSASVIAMRVNTGSNDIELIPANEARLPAYGTFVFNDKFVLEEDDDLDVYNNASDCDWYVTYIDQDWT